MNPIIEADALTKFYGNKTVVDHLDLRLESGRVHALIGRNGAGKTVTLKMLAGLIRPSSGRCSILGRDSQSLRREEWLRTGYVSENQELYGWMTGAQIIDFTARLYPSWDRAFEKELAAKLDVPLNRRIDNCSRGQKLKLSLLLSMAFKPELLILDEVFAGIDPVVTATFMDSLLELTHQNQWSLLFSTQDIAEVEKLADTVLMIDEGRLQLCEPLESLQERFRRIDLIGEHAPVPVSDKILELRRENAHSRFIHSRFSSATEASLRLDYPHARVSISTLSLKEIFIALARSYRAGGTERNQLNK